MKRLLLAVLLITTPAFADSFTLFVVGGHSLKTWHGQADVQSVAFEWTRPQTKRLEFGFAIEPRVVSQPRSWFGEQFMDGDETVRAMSASFVTRYLFGAGNIHPYAELMVGPMWAERQVPASTSRFNFISQTGFGVVLAGRRISPTIGYRFQHISNGGYAPRNPGLNLNAALLGLRFSR